MDKVSKANPYHDERGRFTSANAAVGGAGVRSGKVKKPRVRRGSETKNKSGEGKTVQELKKAGVPDFVIEGILAEARKHDSPESFRSAFSVKGMQGTYTHLTSDKNFQVDPNKKTFAGSGMSTEPAMFVSGDPKNWKSVFREEIQSATHLTREQKQAKVSGKGQYLAIVTMPNAPKDSYQNTTMGMGHQIYVGSKALPHVVVHKVVPYQQGVRYFNKINNKVWDVLTDGDVVGGGNYRQKLEEIWEYVNKDKVSKFNPYHDQLGRFTFARSASDGGGTPKSRSAKPKVKAKPKATDKKKQDAEIDARTDAVVKELGKQIGEERAENWRPMVRESLRVWLNPNGKSGDTQKQLVINGKKLYIGADQKPLTSEMVLDMVADSIGTSKLTGISEADFSSGDAFRRLAKHATHDQKAHGKGKGGASVAQRPAKLKRSKKRKNTKQRTKRISRDWGALFRHEMDLKTAGRAEVEKANPYKDEMGRFTSANNAVAPKGGKKNAPSRLHSTMQKKGGFTYDARTNRLKRTGFAVSIDKSAEKVTTESNFAKNGIEMVKKFLAEQRERLGVARQHLGGWIERGKVYLDISTVVRTAQEAADLGRKHDQIAFFDLATFTTWTRFKTTAGYKYLASGTQTSGQKPLVGEVPRLRSDEDIRIVGKAEKVEGVILCPVESLLDDQSIQRFVEQVMATSKVSKGEPTSSDVHLPTIMNNKKRKKRTKKMMLSDIVEKKAKLKDPKGGLTAAGRAHFNRTTGSNLKPGVKGKADTPEKMRRKGSFLTRFFTNPSGPMKDDKGRPTRLALSAAAWGEPVPSDRAAAARLAQKGRNLLDRYESAKKKKK